MKAARLHAYHQPLVIEEVPDPEITGPFDIIVRTGAAGLCRTDLHIQWGEFEKEHADAGLDLPYIPGHESAGWIEAVGEGVKHLAVGDAVILHPFVTCGVCAGCRAGDDMRCENAVFPGLYTDGGFAQKIKTGARAALKIADNLHPVDVAPVACGGVTAYHAVKRAAKLLVPGTQVVVIGAGGLGHVGIQCLTAMTPAEIIVVDKNAAALELAKSWGAEHTVLVDGDQVEAVKALTKGRGADVVIDYVAERGAEKWGVDMLRSFGTYFVVGYGGELQVETKRIINNELNFVGNLIGNFNELGELLALMAQGKVTLHTKTYPLEQINEAMADLEGGRLQGRGIIVPNES
ncbi:NAD(P)-dependent alcohol dehydrogenase [Micromonospora sp. NPDC005237]|uniref:NAD(P)-dependent alcohol dehydrogenase n=1 Tax=Micromonospora sp. NPDC005237 TaxID=3155113 RepID=UPI0033B45D80